MKNISKEAFMDCCREFEAAVKLKYQLDDGDSAYMYIASLPQYISYRDEIHVIRVIRNMYAHNNIEIEGQDALVITPLLYGTVKKITHAISHPTLVKDKMITNICCAKMDDKVTDKIREMQEKGLSHLPILDENRCLYGVFSQNSIFTRVSKETLNAFSLEDCISDYQTYLPIHQHGNETFGFISYEEDIEKAKGMFTRSKKDQKRMVMLFVNKHGKEDEPILGLLTPLDVLE